MLWGKAGGAMQVRKIAMVVATKIVLPYEPQYVGHRVAEERRKAVSEWLRQRESELDEHRSPSVVPEHPWMAERQASPDRRESLKVRPS
jgi:hypothetical protein